MTASALDLFARRPKVVWFCCVFVSALGIASELTRLPTADMGLFLYDASRVLDGARLYRDVVEINPPLIILLNLPVVLVARATHLSPFLLYRLSTACLICAVLIGSGQLISRYVLPDDPGRRGHLVLLFWFVLFALARSDFGQREHFVLALLVPYLLLVAGKRSGRGPTPLVAGIVGILAGCAIGLKPHFVLVWVALELYGRRRVLRSEHWRPSPEVAGVLGFLALYALATLVLTPDYFRVATLLGPAYERYLRRSFFVLLVIGPGVPLVGFTLLARIGLRRDAVNPELRSLVALAMIASFVAAAAQEKEFRYHFYPALGLAFVLLGLLAVDAPQPLTVSERVYGRAARALLCTVAVVVLGWAAFQASGGGMMERRQRAALFGLVDTVRRRSKGGLVGVLSYTIDSSFPLVNYAGVPLALRFPSLWPMAASYWNAIASGGPLRYHSPQAMDPFERYFFRAVRDDLLSAQPSVLLILRPARDAPENGQRRLQYVEYLNQDPALAALLAQYGLVGQEGEYLVYQRRTDDASAGAAPSAEPATLDVRRHPQLRQVTLHQLDPESVIGAGVFGISWLLLAMWDRRHAARLARAGSCSRRSGAPQ